jgi:PAS domain S-box-containing protein
MFAILYVDDEPGLLEIGKLFLEQGGRFTVDTLTSATEALDVLRIGHYDAIISDYQMPVMNGIEFLKRVRASGNQVPFIVFTGRGREEIVIQALNEGADFYLQKGGEPVSQFAELGHKLQTAILQRSAEASIRDHERREADIINFLPDATFAIDRAGRVISWNRAIEEMTGIPASQMLGKGDHEYAIPFYGMRRPILIDLIYESDEVIAGKYSHIIHEKNVLIADTSLPQPKGKPLTLMGKASPLYNRQGEIIGAIESIRDITQMKNAEERVRESEGQFSAFMDRLPVTAFIKDDHFTNLYVNRYMKEIFGSNDWVGKSVRDLFPKEAAEKMIEDDQRTLQEGYRKAIEILRGKDGKLRTFETYKFRIDRENKPPLIGGFAVEISEREKVVKALHESEKRFRDLTYLLPQVVYEADIDGRLKYANHIAFDLFGYTEEEFQQGLNVMQMVVPSDRERAVAAFHALAEGKETADAVAEYQAQRKDGTTFPVSIYSSPIVVNGRIAGLRGIIVDITERKVAEDTIRESEQKYRTVFETTGTATVLIENDGTISLANSEFERLSGYAKNEIENRKKWTEFVVQEDLERMLAQHQLRRQNHTSALTHYEFRFSSRSGELHDIYLTIDVIPGTTKSVASLLDITERKRVENSLITANQEYTNLLDQIQDVYYRSDVKGRLVKASRSLATLLGYDDLSECLGRSIAVDFYFNPSDRKQFREEVYRNGKVTDYEVQLKRKDGTPVLVATSSHLYRDPAGKVLGIEGTFRDITERKRQEHILRTQRDLGLALQTVHGMHETLEICMNAAIDISGLDAGGIYLIDEGAGCVDLFISRNLGDGFVNTVSHYPANSANWQIVMTGKPIYSQYSESGLAHTSVEEKEGLRASAIIPIAFQNRITACLNMASHTLDEIPLNARIALETIAAQIGTAIERIRADEALADSEERYRNIIEDQTEFICRFKPDGTHVFVNEAYCRYFGLGREDLIGHRFRPEIPPEEREPMKRFFDSLTPDHPVDTVIHRISMPDGRSCWQRWSDRAIFDAAGNVIEYQSVGRDITEQKTIEEVLRQKSDDLDSRNRLISTLLDTVPIGIFMVEAPSGKPIIANKEAARLLGRGILPDATEENLADVYEAYRAGTAERYPTGEMPIICGMYGESRHIDDLVIVRPEGTRVQLEIFGTPVADSLGRVVASLACFLDITERKRDEQVIREANRKINLLTSITRHDVTNQVAILRGFTRIALMKKPDPVISDILEKIDAAVSAIARQIEFTKAYQELGMQTPGWQRIRDIVAQQKTEGISLSCTCNAEVFADPMLERVFYNLIDNAVRHGETVTAITVSCRPDPDGLVIIVSDNGVGVPHNLKDTIFEKGYGKNTGFGLFLAREILAITGIIIIETGTYRKGAQFEIVVPKGTYRITS